jgi:adenosylmethionine-8-amino-7-oxononanoate aminotransferase
MKDSNFLKEMNARSVWHPMAHPAEMQAHPPTIVTGATGVRITDVDGHEVVDGVGGLWNVNLGFSCEPIKRAITEQLDRLPYYSIFRGTTNDAVIQLAEELRDFFEPDGLARAFFTSGGSDSVETALRLARQYHKIRGEAGRVKFLSLKKGYHGTHFGGASVNGNANFRSAYEPLLAGLPPHPRPLHLSQPFNESDPERLAQLMPGSAGGRDRLPGAGHHRRLHHGADPGRRRRDPAARNLHARRARHLHRHGILLIADEVITAFGRTGSWTGSRHWGVQPDMMATAKAITNGYFPVGAVMISEQVAEVFEGDDSGRAMIGHGYTYSGHPVGAAAALACLAETLRLDVPTNAAARGRQVHDGFKALQDKHDIVGDVRGGHGLMTAMELVSDRATKTPLDKDTIGRIQAETYRAGAMVRISGPNVILSPPLVLTAASGSPKSSASS